MWSWSRVVVLAATAVGAGAMGGVLIGLLGALTNYGWDAFEASSLLYTSLVAGYSGVVYGFGGFVAAVLATIAVALVGRTMQRSPVLRATAAAVGAALGMVGFFLLAFSPGGISYSPAVPALIGVTVGMSAFAAVTLCSRVTTRR